MLDGVPRSRLRVAVTFATVVVALVTLGAGLAHSISITRTALARDGLFDARHTTLLVVGWTLVGPSVAWLASARAMWRGRAWGYPTALAIGAFLLVEYVLLGSTLGTPAQAIPAYVAAVAYLALVGVAWRRARSA